MQIKEILTESSKALFERLDKDNDTGFLTEDLVEIVRADQGHWKKMPDDPDAFNAYIDSITNSQ